MSPATRPNRTSTALAIAAALAFSWSCCLQAEEAPTLPCLYSPRATPENPMPEIVPHEDCARLTESGEPAIRDHHLKAASYSDGLAVFLVASEWYYVRPDGSSLQVIAHDNGPDSWSEGLVRTLRNGKIAYADASFDLVIPARYDWGWPFEEGRALVCRGCRPGTPDGEHTPIEGGEWGYIDRAGNEVVPVQLSRMEAMARNRETSKEP